MAWTDPKTWTGVLVTVADLNSYIRDNDRGGPQAATLGGAFPITSPAAGRTATVIASGEVWTFVYDGTKWYSTPLPLLGNQAGTINSATYSTLAAVVLPSTWSTLVTAGFVPYWRVSGFVSAAAGTETTTAAVSVASLAALAAEPSPGVEFGATVSGASSAQQLLDTGWVTTSAPATAAALWAAIRIKSSGVVNAKTQSRFSLSVRWQSS